jgi:UDP-N-acetylglucosamine--N-acetylmuramyl-(pentapeptide) pyrophosphoryl-undecaprenol N-acetylglucosamine transferase
MRVVFCGGGTGGHVYPALTVAAALRQAVADLALLYVGVRGRMDQGLVAREGIDFQAVTAKPLRVGNPIGAAKGAAGVATGVVEALSILRRFRPDVVFATGGYGSVGVSLAARLLRKPLLLFLPDVEAGMAVKAIAKFADKVAVSVPPAAELFPKEKAVVTGYPVRPSFVVGDQAEARGRLGLHPSLPVVLVSGASSGASRLNDSVAAWAPEFLRVGQLIHLTGTADEMRLQNKRLELPAELQARYHLHAYLHDDIALAYAAADLAVMRSGASTLGELPAARLPAILVPGEYEGWDQSPNARYLESQGAAVLLPQSRIEELPALFTELLRDSDRRDRMKSALATLARPDAPEQLARLLIDMASAQTAVAA